MLRMIVMSFRGGGECLGLGGGGEKSTGQVRSGE